ncbi:WG repeat-containing protein [Cellvibrio sp. OA-2007]|uniref:WG repeat-containing protein n=1 Tax=Cellvibrio sp. OA-2007 TaxID=529823 RepID=UPI000782D640|nr:WG repeat-containing protein [Cellvibrio sp. OA-2007]
MKKLVAFLILVAVFNAKAEKLDAAWQWDSARYYNGIVILQRNSPESFFKIFDPSTQKYYRIENFANSKASRIKDVDFFRDQPYLRVDIESTDTEKWSSSGVVDSQGNWIIKSVDFSVTDVALGYAVGHSPSGALEIRNFEDNVILSFPREWRCKIVKLEGSIIFPCENSSKIIRLNLNDKSNIFTELEFSGEYSGTNKNATLFVMHEPNKTILYSETKGKLYEFPANKGITFYTDNLFGLHSLHTSYTEGYYHLEQGLLKLKTGEVHSIEGFGNSCLKWRATVDGVESTRVLDDHAKWHDAAEDVKNICGVKSIVSASEQIPTPTLKPVKTEADLCGYQNAQGEWQIPPEFSWCSEFVEQAAVIRKEGIYGVINQKGQWITEKPVNRNRIVKEWDARDSSRINTGVINKQGQWVIPPMLNEDESYLTDQGVYSCAFKSVSGCYRLNFSGELEQVSVQKVEHLKKEKINADRFKVVEDRLMPSAIDGVWGYQGLSGEWLIAPKYAEAEHFSGGVARVAQLDEQENLIWGLVDEKGRELVRPQYQEIQNFYQKVTWFRQNDSWGLIDQNGAVLIEPQFSNVKPFKSDLASARTASWLPTMANRDLLVNFKGEIIQPNDPIPEYIDAFSEDARYARAYTGKDWGYIDREGKWLGYPNFRSASQFIGDHAFVSVGDYEYRIEGRKIIWQPPAEEQSSYIVKHVQQIGGYPVLLVKILQGSRESVGLISGINGEWIRVE